MNPKNTTIAAIALGMVLVCALFPPRRRSSGDSGGRGFLLSPNLTRANVQSTGGGGKMWTPVQVDGERFLCECVFILSAAGLAGVIANARKPA